MKAWVEFIRARAKDDLWTTGWHFGDWLSYATTSPDYPGERLIVCRNPLLAAERRRMPMIRVEKDYRFTAPGGGNATLLDLFDGSRQLVVYRFFMDPDMDVYPERGCPGCSTRWSRSTRPATPGTRVTCASPLRARGCRRGCRSRASRARSPARSARPSTGWRRRR